MKVEKPIKNHNRNNNPVIEDKVSNTNETKNYKLMGSIIPSKVMVIDNLNVTINESLSGKFTFEIDSNFIPFKNGVISIVDISANEEIIFDDNMKLEKLKSIIRRCGILEKYKEYYTNDPEIIINSYTLDIHKEYQFFDEFKEGILIAGDMFN